MQNNTDFLKIEHLSKHFKIKKKNLYAVREVSFTLKKGECLGIVGESGCGKSTLVKMIVGSLRPSDGKISLNGTDIWALKGAAQRSFRRNIQMVFQDPASSFSPRMRIGDYLCEPRRNYDHIPKTQALEEAKALLREVELSEFFLDRLPHQLSGGQLQRVAIARALAISPALLVCDEATGALDVSIQNQVIQLLACLQRELQISCLFIGHDLALVRSVSQRIAVMYLGSVVEIVRSETLSKDASHPYTRALLDAVFDVYDRQDRDIHLLIGDPPSPLDFQPGCPFAQRCSSRIAECLKTAPALLEVEKDHLVACHLIR